MRMRWRRRRRRMRRMRRLSVLLACCLLLLLLLLCWRLRLLRVNLGGSRRGEIVEMLQADRSENGLGSRSGCGRQMLESNGGVTGCLRPRWFFGHTFSPALSLCFCSRNRDSCVSLSLFFSLYILSPVCNRVFRVGKSPIPWQFPFFYFFLLGSPLRILGQKRKAEDANEGDR
jgi:hypothetical protein